MLAFLDKLTSTPEEVSPADADALRRSGISHAAARDAIYVAFLFAFYTRAADALGFAIPTDDYQQAPKVLLSPIGYR